MIALTAVGRLDVGGEDEFVGEFFRLGIAQHKALLVVADGGADHLAGNRQKFLVERTHQHDRPFDEAGDFIQQHLILDEFEPLRKRQLLGVGQDRILAALGIEHDLGLQQLCFVILKAAHGDRLWRHEAMAECRLAGLDAVDGELHDVRLFGLQTEGRGDRMQRPHPGQRARSGRPRAPAHRFRPRKGADDDGKDFGKHVERGTAGLFDQRDVEIALFRIALDLRLIERGQPCRFQKARDCSLRAADARTFPLFLQIGLPRGNAVHGQRQAPRRREGFRALINEAFGDQFVRDHAAQIVSRFRLHARGDFFGKQLKQEIWHQTGSSLCEPSQSGIVFVRLQVQKNTRLVSGAMNCTGEKPVPSWLPSQNGWVLDLPQAHHQYSSPACT